MQALKTQFERDMAAKEEQGEEKRRGMGKQEHILFIETDFMFDKNVYCVCVCTVKKRTASNVRPISNRK